MESCIKIVVEGGVGMGKTYIINLIRKVLEEDGYKVQNDREILPDAESITVTSLYPEGR